MRAIFEQDWRDIRDLIRPVSGEINPYGPNYVPARRSDKCFDATAVDSCEELASALHSYLTSPVERWFSLEIVDAPEEMEDPEVLLWLEQTADVIFHAYSDARAQFNTALHEIYLDLAAYGIAHLSQEWSPNGHLKFKTHPVGDCWIMENNDEIIDTIHRVLRWSVRQIAQEFGDLPPMLAREKNIDKVCRVLHAVYPRTDRSPVGASQKSMEFASVWLCEDTKEMLRESGYRSFPYHCPRWVKIAGECYGRSPAMKCLPDVRMLNSMELTIIKAAEKIVDPPLQVPDEGFLSPIRTSPGAIMYKEPNAEHIEPLLTQGNIPVGLEYTDRKREQIKKAFYNDWLRMEKQNTEMTAYEVQDRRDEKLRLLAPMLGRQETELLGPMISRTLELLSDKRKFPQAPDSIIGKRMKASYSSPASRAQTGIKAVTMGSFVQELLPLAQVNPQIMDVIDFDAYTRELAIARGVTRTILRDQKALDAIRQNRQQQQAMQSVAQTAEPASKAIKNLADAQEKGGGLVGAI